MGLFGFGKKKQPEPAPKSVPTPEPSPMDAAVSSFLKSCSTGTPISSAPAKKVWSEDVNQFLTRNENAKLVKLTGNPEDFASYSVGNRCQVEEDYEKEKFAVTCGDCVIGYLPSSAVTYAEKHDTTPDALVVIIAEVEYDIEKERDIISVYIAD